MQHGTPPPAAGTDVVRMLAFLAACPVPDVRTSLSDKLGQWLGWKGALQLSAALSAGPGPAPAAPARQTSAAPSAPSRRAVQANQAVGAAVASSAPTTRAPAQALAASCTAQWQAQRRQLEQAIDALPAPTAADRQDPAAYRFQVQQLQKTLQENTGQWRERLRLALQGHSPAGASLAALDGVMDRALHERERGLSAEVLRALQQQLQQAPGERFGPALQTLARQLLRAELEHRELPLLGLLAALQGDAGTDPAPTS